jgi:two-component system chemotaxis response regulator CheB
MRGPEGQPGARFRLVIIEDSPFYRLRFSKIFGRGDRLSIVGTAASGQEGIHLVASVRPDVILLDLNMPGIDGFGVLRWVMSRQPTPIVVCSSRRDRESIFRALELGAVDYITKPESSRGGLERVEAILVERVEAAARARLDASGRCDAPRQAIEQPLRAGRRAALIGIAASTGGPAAIQKLVRDLPRELTVPIVVVQHMPAGFTRSFAERLERLSHYGAIEAREGARVAAETIYVAPGGMQVAVARDAEGVRLVVTPREPGDVHAPSADRFFASLAEVCAAAAVAVVLTGMGDDGSRGVCSVKERGGYVLAEASESALIYGMPRAALATGCADAELPLARMPEAFLALARGGVEEQGGGVEGKDG